MNKLIIILNIILIIALDSKIFALERTMIKRVNINDQLIQNRNNLLQKIEVAKKEKNMDQLNLLLLKAIKTNFKFGVESILESGTTNLAEAYKLSVEITEPCQDITNLILAKIEEHNSSIEQQADVIYSSLTANIPKDLTNIVLSYLDKNQKISIIKKIQKKCCIIQ